LTIKGNLSSLGAHSRQNESGEIYTPNVVYNKNLCIFQRFFFANKEKSFIRREKLLFLQITGDLFNIDITKKIIKIIAQNKK